MKNKPLISYSRLEIEAKRKTIVVVLGMYRSGVGIVARGLQVLGVKTGNQSLSLVSNDSNKELFEDADINAINIDLYKSLGQGRDWHTLGMIRKEDLFHEKHAALRLRAIEILRSRLQIADCLGIGDSRMCHTLPFWQSIFEYLQLDISYVIAIRNPLSVAKSLERRNNLAPEKSYYLWLQHIHSSMMATRKTRRVLVDYDALLADPEQQITRIARTFDFKDKIDPIRLDKFSEDFLDPSLRNTHFQPEDVFQDPVVPNPVRAATMLLNSIMEGKLDVDSEESDKVLTDLSGQMEGMTQAMSYLFRLDGVITDMNSTLINREQTIELINQDLLERDSRITSLNEVIHSKDMCIHGLDRKVMELEHQVEMLVKVMEERNTQSIVLSQRIQDKDAHIESLDTTIIECNKKIESLSLALNEYETHSNQLLQVEEEKDSHIYDLNQTIIKYGHQIELLLQAAKEHETQIELLSQRLQEKDIYIFGLNETITKNHKKISELLATVEAEKKRQACLHEALHDKENRVYQLEQTVKENEKWIEELLYTIEEYETNISSMTLTLQNKIKYLDVIDLKTSEQEKKISFLEQQLEESKFELASASIILHDKDDKIDHLEKTNADSTRHIELITQSGHEKGIVIQKLQSDAIQLTHYLEKCYTSTGWKLFKPIRVIRNILVRMGRRLAVELVPVSRLQRNGSKWIATDSDVRFLLVTERPWRYFIGWHWLEIEVISEQSHDARLYFDTGKGFDDLHSIEIKFPRKGMLCIPLFVSYKCHTICLKLEGEPKKFEILVHGLNRLENPPVLPDEFFAQSAVYEALGWREGNVAVFEPMHDVQRHSSPDYCWSSVGIDPWFSLGGLEKVLRPGWYMIQMRIRMNTDRGRAKFYFDHGAGYSEAITAILPFKNGEMVERLYFLPSIPRQVRFDPLDVAAQFSVECLRFLPVTQKFAHHGMLEYLSRHYTRHRNRSIEYIWQDLQSLADKKKISSEDLLYRRYHESFSAQELYQSINYAEWIDRFEMPFFSDSSRITEIQKTLNLRPVISVIMPVYNTDEVFLRRAILSVLAQSYDEWELCIADDASSHSYIRKILEEYARNDPRIKLIFRFENGHISASSNSALSLATGEFIALMDHDDELAEHALLFMVEAINQNPSAQILYSDEDKLDESGNRSDPHFKPDWNPDLFLSQNYISHLGIYRRELIETIGGFRLGVEGSQDQDLLLRCIPHIKQDQIIHIPKILYHWRMMEGSTALASGEKNYTTQAGIKALQDYFSNQGRNDVRVEEGLASNTYRIRYPIPNPEPLVSLLVPTRDMLEVLRPCINSILRNTIYQNYEIIILNNESVELATIDYFKYIQQQDSRIRILSYPYPFNYSAINNYGAKHAKGELIGLINNDVEIINPEWLEEMVSHALRPEIGCVGAKLYYGDNTIQHGGVIVGLGGVAGHSHKCFPRTASGYFNRLKIVQNLSAVTAACLLIRKSIYKEVGGLEEANLRIAFNDVDFCLKVRKAGYRNLWTPYAELYHYESKSRGTEDTPEKQARFNSEIEFIKTKWGEILQHDPFYNQNLTRAREDFSIGV